MKKTPDLRLYGVFDPLLTPDIDPKTAIRQALDGGMTMLQLRDKRDDRSERLQLAKLVQQELSERGVLMIVNDHIDIAHEVGAGGVHLGRTDTDPKTARAQLGRDAVIGVTIHHGYEAQRLEPGIADYAGLGPVYLTGSKDPGDPPLGPLGLERLIRAVKTAHPNLPCVGIAGITEKNAAPVIQAGANGVAVISNLFKAPDIELAARRLRRAVDHELQRQEVA